MPVATVLEVATDATNLLVKLGVPTLAGTGLGAFLAHRFSRDRDHENRIAADERHAAQNALAGAQSAREAFQALPTPDYHHLPGDWRRKVEDPLRLVRNQALQDQNDAVRAILFAVMLGKGEGSAPWVVLEAMDRFIALLERWVRGDPVQPTLPSVDEIHSLIRDEEHKTIVLTPLRDRLLNGISD